MTFNQTYNLFNFRLHKLLIASCDRLYSRRAKQTHNMSLPKVVPVGSCVSSIKTGIDNNNASSNKDSKNNNDIVSTLFFFYKNVFFPAQAEYSYFSADFRLRIFLYYS